MAQELATIAFDADDTLWHNERFFQITQEHFAALLAPYTDSETLAERLLEAEKRNLHHYGFGIKGFVLSMIETAVEVTKGAVPGTVIGEILTAGRDMLNHPVELLPHARETVLDLAGDYRLMLITKGDLLHQEQKIAASGLAEAFDVIEIVSDKSPATYSRIFARADVAPGSVLMTGNSIRSDILPVIEIGGHAALVPHGLEWEIEKADPPLGHPRYHALKDLGDLPALVRALG